MAMAVLAALSLMVAGCGGKEEAKKERRTVWYGISGVQADYPRP